MGPLPSICAKVIFSARFFSRLGSAENFFFLRECPRLPRLPVKSTRGDKAGGGSLLLLFCVSSGPFFRLSDRPKSDSSPTRPDHYRVPPSPLQDIFIIVMPPLVS